jgi:hypothetical protein
MVVAAVVAGDGEGDNVRIDSRRREFPDAQASPVTRPSRRVTVPVTRFAPLSRVHRVGNAEEDTESILKGPPYSVDQRAY